MTCDRVPHTITSHLIQPRDVFLFIDSAQELLSDTVAVKDVGRPPSFLYDNIVEVFADNAFLYRLLSLSVCTLCYIAVACTVPSCMSVF